MTATLQVLYPIGDDTTFDYDYYASSHYKILHDTIGAHIESDQVVKGLTGGPDVPPPFYAVYTGRFKDMATLQAALAEAGPVLADIPNYYNAQPTMLIGEEIG
jgi:uncharacterized protein (TIGR02118 family)